MILNIDPKVDCVFKALLGSEENKDLLIHFLNAMMNLPPGERIMDVQILNPHIERKHLEDKRTVVDVLAVDNRGNVYQVDLQTLIHPYLQERMGFNWASLLSTQMSKGDKYEVIKPVVSIWLLGNPMFPHLAGHLHRLRLSDWDTQAIIMARSMVCIVELPKLCFEGPVVKNEGERWQRFFVEGERLDPDNLPEYMKTPEMEKAMDTLMSFHRLGGERAAQYLLEHFAELKANTIESAREQAEERARLAIEQLLDAEAKREAAEEALKLANAKIAEAKAQAEAQAHEAESKAQDAESKAHEAESKAQDAESKAQDAESKAQDAEAKLQALQAKLLELGIEPDAL